MKKLTDYEKGFIEGVIDSDGCITFYKSKTKRGKRGWRPHIRLTISNNSKEFLNKFQQILGTNKTLVSKKGSKKYQIAFSHNILRELFPQINLIIKEKRRTQTIKILAHIKQHQNKGFTSEEYELKLNQLIDEWNHINRKSSTRNLFLLR